MKAKEIFQYWKQYGDQMGVKIIPTFVVEDYATKNNGQENDFHINFNNVELEDLAYWCKANINSTEIAVYDIYRDRQIVGRDQLTKLWVLKTAFGDKIIRIGCQPSTSSLPSEYLNPYLFKRGVQDTWSALCEGKTNAFWESPGTLPNNPEFYGKKKLLKWVNDRQMDTPTIPISWNLIPVAWNYDHPSTDPYGYTYPGDDEKYNDPPVAGRISSSHSYIVNAYTGGSGNQLFGGYSCDLHILNANSAGKPENPSFYDQIKSDQLYTGYFASGINQGAAVYDLYDN